MCEVCERTARDTTRKQIDRRSVLRRTLTGGVALAALLRLTDRSGDRAGSLESTRPGSPGRWRFAGAPIPCFPGFQVTPRTTRVRVRSRRFGTRVLAASRLD